MPPSSESNLGLTSKMRETLADLARFPGTVPTLFIMNYLQAQHIDTDFYDKFFRPGAYLPSHAEHLARWH